jgi:hypothetical protein
MASTELHAHAVRFPVKPRLIPAAKVARWLHLSIDEFRQLLPALRMEGFPAACPVTGHYDLVALEAWQDKRSGLSGGLPVEDRAAIMRARIASLGKNQA